ncbi:MAG: hypothetical protein JNJ54_04130 [Myxococcaceae bacterium]|nr:hypothetical protein [Myxococcaceae bacterium]
MRALACLAVMAVTLGSSDVEACSCQAPGPPCESMFTSTVFVGKVKTTTPAARGAATTTFEVLETLHSKAALGPTVEVRHRTDGNVCGIAFTPGRSYVVYAGGTAPGALSAGACTRTHELKKNDQDVAFAHALPKRSQALIEGRLFRADGHEDAPVEGVEVGVVDAGVSVKTNATGAFRLLVPPGTWPLELRSEGVTAWQREPSVVSVPHAAACASPSIAVQWNGRLFGRVTSADAKPVAGVEVHALSRRPGDRHWRLSEYSAADGTFEIRGAAPGEYLIALSPEDFGGPSPQNPWPTTWAPGVGNVKQAKTFTLSRGGRVGPIALVAPTRLETVTVHVAVKRAGKPVTSAVVSLVPVGANRSTGGLTDDQGTWTAVEFAGQRVKLRVCSEQQTDCVEQERAFDADVTLEVPLDQPR